MTGRPSLSAALGLALGLWTLEAAAQEPGSGVDTSEITPPLARCTGVVESAELIRALGTAEAYFSSLNAAGFRSAMDEVEFLLPCAVDAIPQHVVAEFHRFQGIRAFLDQDPSLSTRSFAAARTVEPDYSFPEFLVPQGSPILKEYEAVDPAYGERDQLSPPREGYFQFDGRPSLERATSWPTVVQHFDKKGAVLKTVYLKPQDAFFEYALPKPKIASVPLLVASGVVLVSSAVFLGVADNLRDNYYDDLQFEGVEHEVRNQELQRLKKKTNAFAITSGALLFVGAGLGGSAFLIVRL